MPAHMICVSRVAPTFRRENRLGNLRDINSVPSVGASAASYVLAINIFVCFSVRFFYRHSANDQRLSELSWPLDHFTCRLISVSKQYDLSGLFIYFLDRRVIYSGDRFRIFSSNRLLNIFHNDFVSVLLQQFSVFISIIFLSFSFNSRLNNLFLMIQWFLKGVWSFPASRHV